MRQSNLTTGSMRQSVFSLAWQFVRKNGYSLSKALKCAWANIKLKAQLKVRIVKFYFKKVDGSIREAYGTLADNILPTTGGNRKANDSIQVYYDTEKEEYRCYKKANLLSIA